MIFGGWRDVCLGWDDLFLWYACVTCVLNEYVGLVGLLLS